MSVINKMLLELEQRQSEQALFGTVQGQLRGVPSRRRFGAMHWFIAGLAVTGCAAAFMTAFSKPPYEVQGIAAAGQSAAPAPQASVISVSATSDIRAGAEPANTESPITTAEVEHLPQMASLSAAPATASVSQPKPAQQEAKTAPIEPRPAEVTVAKKTGATDGNVGKLHKPAADLAKAAAPTADSNEAFNKQVTELTSQQSAENEYRRASALIHQGRLSDALSVLEQALELDSQHWGALQAMVGILVETKRHDEAIRRLQARIVADRAQVSLAMMLARLQVDKGDMRGAIDTLYKTSPYASQRADYQAFLAALYQREGLHKEAIDCYMLALGKTPQNGIWWMGLGISLQAQNRMAEARDAYRQARDSSVLSAELYEFVELRLSQIR